MQHSFCAGGREYDSRRSVHGLQLVEEVTDISLLNIVTQFLRNRVFPESAENWEEALEIAERLPKVTGANTIHGSMCVPANETFTLFTARMASKTNTKFFNGHPHRPPPKVSVVPATHSKYESLSIAPSSGGNAGQFSGGDMHSTAHLLIHTVFCFSHTHGARM